MDRKMTEKTELRMPGKHWRTGMTIIELFAMFPDDETAERWFEEQRWGKEGPACPECGSCRYAVIKNRNPMPYRCKDCRKHYSVRKGMVMDSSKIGLQKWAIAIYMVSTSLKGVSSMKLHRELGIRQSSAWHMLQRIREAFNEGSLKLSGPVEVDETFVGGKEANKHSHKKLRAGRGTVGKVAVVGAKDRETGKVVAKVVEKTDAETLQGFVMDHVLFGTPLYTDEHKAYTGLGYVYDHGKVKHSVGEYVNEQIHINGMESFWSTLKRAHKGTFHKLSKKHLQRYVNEFAGRHNIRELDTIDQMSVIVEKMDNKRLRYKDLIA